MTKEEILISKTSKIKSIHTSVTLDLQKAALEAMQQYADQEKKQEAIAFAEWLGKQNAEQLYKQFKQ